MMTSNVPVQAAQEQQNVIYQPNARMGISSTTLSAGETVNIIDNDGQAFYVPGEAKISFSINLKTSGSVELLFHFHTT